MPDPNKPAVDALRSELDYRRKKQWDIFSWTMTLLLASIGGIFALAAKGEFKSASAPRWALAVALASIAYYAWRWIWVNMRLESAVRAKLLQALSSPYVTASEIPDPIEGFSFGYREAIVLVGLAAVVLVLVPPGWFGVR